MALVALLAPGLAPAEAADPQMSNIVYAIVEGQLLSGVSNPSKVDDRGTVMLQSVPPGVGSGEFAGQKVSACYGLLPKDAMKHLKAPAGQKLVVEDGQLVLKPAA